METLRRSLRARQSQDKIHIGWQNWQIYCQYR
ncbi:hypothetical protein [Nostoc sp.]